MPALHASVTDTAAPDVDVEAPHDRPHRWEVFLILGGDPLVAHHPATVRTGGRHRDGVRLVDVRGRAPLPMTAVGRTGLAPRPARGSRRGALRERRGLPRTRAPRGVEFVLQPFVLSPQPITLTLCSFQLAAQADNLAIPVLDHLLRIVAARRPVGTCAHAPVMADIRNLYKYKLLDPV